MTWPILSLLAFLATALLSAALTWRCHVWAPRWGFLDRPLSEAHKAHRKATPVLGGLAMSCAWLAVTLGGLALLSWAPALLCAGARGLLPGLEAVRGRLLTVALGAVCMTALGMRDDRHAMPAGRKFLLQFLVAALVALDVRISLFHSLPGLDGTLPWLAPALNWLVTSLWIMTVVNALNFFDNMDGLAGGTAMIAAAFFLLIALLRGQAFVALLSAATCGAAAGFLVFNRPPASIFMGDGGSHFLGYCLALSGILTTFFQHGESPTATPLLIPLLVLSLPLFDAVAVVCIRLREHRPIYIGDTRHISHRFAQLGLTRAQSVYLIWLLCVIQGTGALTLVWLPFHGACLVFLQAIAMFLVITIIQFFVPEKQS